MPKHTRSNQPKVAIIGAGMAGLSAAQYLNPQCDVKLFDKSRGVGGRMSTRYARAYEFDHGAQYFTARDAEFQTFLAAAIEAGVAAPWEARGGYLKHGKMLADTGSQRFVGTPRMNSLPKYMSQDLDVSLGRRVCAIKRTDNQWRLTFETNTGNGCDETDDEAGYDALICTVPPEQAQTLLPQTAAFIANVKSAKMQACFALMIGLESEAKLAMDWDSLRLDTPPLAWMAVNSRKASRAPNAPCLVIHADANWSQTHQDEARDWVQNEMLLAANDICEMELSTAPHIALHRWLYASPQSAQTFDGKALFDEDLNLAACGDWCAGGRVEGAWLSGRSAAKHVLQRLKRS